MYGVASIPVSPPQNAFRERDVRHELTVWGKSDEFGRNASEPGLEPMGLRVIANQFASQDDTMGKYLRPVFAGNGRIPADWA